MKRTISIFFSSIFLSSLALSAQDAPRSPLVRKGMPKVEQKVKQREDKTSLELSHRAQEFLAEDSIASEQIAWRRAVYRFIDLMQSANAPLSTPEIPTKQEANLFTHIFRLYATGQLPVYEYIDGAERLDDAHRLSFPDFLERFHINYIEGQEHTIPSSEVKAYYLKKLMSLMKALLLMPRKSKRFAPYSLVWVIMERYVFLSFGYATEIWLPSFTMYASL